MGFVYLQCTGLMAKLPGVGEIPTPEGLRAHYSPSLKGRDGIHLILQNTLSQDSIGIVMVATPLQQMSVIGSLHPHPLRVVVT